MKFCEFRFLPKFCDPPPPHKTRDSRLGLSQNFVLNLLIPVWSGRSFDIVASSLFSPSGSSSIAEKQKRPKNSKWLLD